MATGLLIIIYIAFISLGLPDSLLGAAWPMMYGPMGMQLQSAGILSMLIAGSTIVSSLLSARAIRKFGTASVTAVSVAMTAAALLGFSYAPSFVWMCLCALPLGLGAGAVDSGLNNYVALHYKAKHMSWLHCFWGIGATVGPALMSFFLRGGEWRGGYRVIGITQVVLVVLLVATLPLWKRAGAPIPAAEEGTQHPKVTGNFALFRLRGAKNVLVAFLCYSAIEATTGLWAGSFLVTIRGLTADLAATWTAVFFLGITIGRLVCGFLTMKFSDKNLIRLGQGIALFGVLLLLAPVPQSIAGAGLLFIGLGCAPIFPCLLHATPANFGAVNSQALMGLQMACAYVGSTFAPPLLGLVAQRVSLTLLPFYLLFFLGLMVVLLEVFNRRKPRTDAAA